MLFALKLNFHDKKVFFTKCYYGVYNIYVMTFPKLTISDTYLLLRGFLQDQIRSLGSSLRPLAPLVLDSPLHLEFSMRSPLSLSSLVLTVPHSELTFKS